MKPLADLSDDALAHLARQAPLALPDAPHWLVESVLAMWRAPVAAPSLGRRIMAVLGFDSWASAPTLALRSALPATRQWLFSADDRDIDLRVAPVEGAAGRFAISGQLLGPGDDLQVSVCRGGVELAQVAPDAFGEFRLGDLPAGRYRLTLQVAGEHIELPEIDVGLAAPP